MDTDITRQGLIVTTRKLTTDPLNELIVSCGWPALLAANPRLVGQQLELQHPEWLLFWIDERQEVAPTVKLLTWLRERGPQPCRIVLAYRLEPDVEQSFRSIGVHLYLPLRDHVGAVVENALSPLLERERRRFDAAEAPADTIPAHQAPRTLGTFPEMGRPP